MKFDNETTIYSIHNVKLVLAILVVIYFVLMLITSLPNFIEKYTGLSSGWALGVVIGGYFLFFFYFIFKGTAYVSYNDEGSKIIIRTFKINPFNSKKIALEISKSEFHKFTISKTYFKEELNLFVRKGGKISKYPPISIVSVPNDQKQPLLSALKKLAEIKES